MSRTAYDVPCPTCGARTGLYCKTKAGDRAPLHQRRKEHAGIAPRSGNRTLNTVPVGPAPTPRT